MGQDVSRFILGLKCWGDIFCIMKPGFEELNIKDQKIIGKLKKIDEK
jgi:hypothetical protein